MEFKRPSDWQVPADELRRILSDYGPYYHVTRLRSWKGNGSPTEPGIRTIGLQPSKYDEGAYFSEVVRGPIVCLSSSTFRDTLNDALRERAPEEPFVQLEIDTYTVAALDVEPDWTHVQTHLLWRRFGNDLGAMLEHGLTLISYDPIPPERIRVVTAFPPLRPIGDVL